MVNKDAMEVEDDLIYKFDVCQEMLDYQSQILDKQSQIVDRQSQMIDRQFQLMEQQTRQLDEQKKLLEDKDRKMAKKLFSTGDSVESIAEFLNIDVEEVRKYVL